MEIVAFFLLGLFIAIVIIVNSFYRSSKKSERNRLYVLPNLGIQEHSEEFKQSMITLIEHLESSLPENYVDRVKERVIREHKISLIEWENRWFEWKRYLVMAALLKSVPMFSREVDQVWHEMLMFTREYDAFCKQFLKTTLHHSPNPPNQAFNPHERAWFDTVYVLLFKPTKFSLLTWGTFLRHPLSKKVLTHFKQGSFGRIAPLYLNVHAQAQVPAVAFLVEWLVKYLQTELTQVEKHISQHGTDVTNFRRYRSISDGDMALWTLQGVLFLSLYHPEQFEDQYQTLFRNYAIGANGSGSACTVASGCSSWDGSGDSGGSDGGGSSCSSSSCGGGSSCGSGGGGCGSSS